MAIAVQTGQTGGLFTQNFLIRPLSQENVTNDLLAETICRQFLGRTGIEDFLESLFLERFFCFLEQGLVAQGVTRGYLDDRVG